MEEPGRPARSRAEVYQAYRGEQGLPVVSALGRRWLGVAIALLLVSGLLAGAGAAAEATATPEATATAKATATPNAVADGAADAQATRIVEPPLSDEPPGTAPQLSPARSLGYFRVEGTGREGPPPGRAPVTFRLPAESLPEAGHVDAVRLYRLEGEEWRPVPTRHVGGDWFRAGATGGSTFAVGFTEPQFAIVDVSVNPETVSRGEAVSVQVTLDNDDVAGSTTFELGTRARTRAETVALGAEATRQFTFELRPREVGAVDVVVDGMTYATVRVTREAGEERLDERRWPAAVPGRSPTRGSRGSRQYFRRESGTPSCSLSASSSASRSACQSKKSSRDSG